jgi:hypothetical protein
VTFSVPFNATTCKFTYTSACDQRR